MYEFALIVSVITLIAVTLAYVRSPVFSMFHPLTIYIAFHALIFVVRPIISCFIDYQLVYKLYEFTPSLTDKCTVIFASNLGFVCFAFFSLRFGNVPMEFKQDNFAIAERNRLRVAFPWVAAICVPIGGFSLISAWNGANVGAAYGTMILDRASGIGINTTGNGYFTDAQLMLASCGALLAWLYRFKLIALLPLLLFVVLRAGTGGRGPFVTALATVGLLHLYEHRRKFPGIKFFALSAAALLIFINVGNDRGRSIRQFFGTDNTSARAVADRSNIQFMEGMDFANMEYFEYLVWVVPQRSGTYDYFLDNLQIFTEPVPRVFWPAKPIGVPLPTVNLWKYGFPIGMTRTVPGEGWYAMGWIGVLVWCSLWGAVLGWLYRRYASGFQNSLQTAVYMSFLPTMIVAYRDGAPISVLRQSLFFITPIILWRLVARWTGIPSAQEMRVRAACTLRRTGITDTTKASADGGKLGLNPSSAPRSRIEERSRARLAALPPAVARRRAALAEAPALKE